MERRVTGNCHARCGAGENPEIVSKDYLSLFGRIGGAADGSDFARALSVIRSRNIRVMLAVQSLGQLQNRYPNNLWAEIIDNADIQLMLGCTDDVTAQYFSARSGDVSIKVDSTSTTRQTMAIAQFIPQYRQTEGQGRRKLLTPEEVLRMPNEELLCIIRGCNVLKLRKLDYTRHPMSGEMERVSIMDYRPTLKVGAPESSSALSVPAAPDRDEPKTGRKPKLSLYSSAKPPSSF